MPLPTQQNGMPQEVAEPPEDLLKELAEDLEATRGQGLLGELAEDPEASTVMRSMAHPADPRQNLFIALPVCKSGLSVEEEASEAYQLRDSSTSGVTKSPSKASGWSKTVSLDPECVEEKQLRGSVLTFAADDDASTDKARRTTFSVADLENATPSLMLKNWDGTEASPESIKAIMSNLSRTKTSEKNSKQLARRFFWSMMLLIFVCGGLIVGMFVVVESSKESHVKDGTMVDLNGKPVHTKLANTYVPLSELPRQSISFLDKLDHVTYSMGTTIKKKSVSGFTWHNSTSIVLDLAPDGEMVIRDGIAFVNDRKNGAVDFIVSKSVSRRLRQTSPSTDKAAYSWEELVSRYNTEISAPGVGGNWRRLAAFDTSGLSDMVAWFGALYESEIAVEEAQAQATGALAAAPCDGMSTENVQAPQMGDTGRMVLTLQQEFNMEEVMGDIQLLYFDFKDAADTKFKLVQRPTLCNKGVSEGGWAPVMAVTEGVGGISYNYEFYHPKSEIQKYYHQSHPALEAALDDAKDTNGLQAAKVVLESSSFNAYKDACNQDAGEAVQGGDAGLDVDNPIDCGRKRFRWSTGGWTLETTVDGQIVGLDAGAGTQHFEVIDVSYPTHGIDFSGCNPQDFNMSSRRLAPSAAPPRHLTVLGDSRRLGAWTDFQAWLSHTNWCGAGTDLLSTTCPASSSGGSDYDLAADKACRRHDHGAKANGIIGGMAVRLGCDIDKDLSQGTGNECAQGIFGSWGLAMVWGCYDHGAMDCWNYYKHNRRRWRPSYWRHGSYCNGEHIHYGPNRYDGHSHTYGYKAKEKNCDGDIW